MLSGFVHLVLLHLLDVCYDDITHNQKLKQPKVKCKLAKLEFKPHK